MSLFLDWGSCYYCQFSRRGEDVNVSFLGEEEAAIIFFSWGNAAIVYFLGWGKLLLSFFGGEGDAAIVSFRGEREAALSGSAMGISGVESLAAVP